MTYSLGIQVSYHDAGHIRDLVVHVVGIALVDTAFALLCHAIRIILERSRWNYLVRGGITLDDASIG